jgi:hypothetical protein
MAKNSTGKTGGPSHVRFIMFEADLAEGEVGQVLQTIQSALRPAATSTIQRIAPPLAPTKPLAPEPQQVRENDVHIEEVLQETEIADTASTPARTRGPRKPAPTPKVIDLDIKSEVSLAPFAEKLNPKSNNHRYLVIAAWLHKHRIDVITVDHIYTCYRSMGWSTDIPDFAQPLRLLKHQQLFTSPERGKYAINHLGLDRAEKLNSGGE